MEINTLYQLLAWQKNNPEILAAADCLLMMPDFFHWCLSGAKIAEFTNATTTQFFHPIKRTWSYDLLKRFNLPTKILPEVVSPGTKVGSLRKSVANRCGLQEIPVIAPASHDTGSAVAAVPALSRSTDRLPLPKGEGWGEGEGTVRQPTPHETANRIPNRNFAEKAAVRGSGGTWAYLSSGTWSLMGIEVGEAQLSKRVLDFNLTNEGGVDGTYRLLKNITGLWLVQQCKRAFEAKGKKVQYSQLVRLAQAAPPLRSFIDPDDPRFANPLDMPTAIRSFCKETRQPLPNSEGALLRCAFESLALKYQTVLECLEQVSGKPIEIIHIVGGGSRNALLNQFTADACNRPVLAGPVEATVFGNVLMQARSCSEIASLKELRAIVRNSCEIQTFTPKPSRFCAWQEARARFAVLGALR
jgi:rhamnulokinase